MVLKTKDFVKSVEKVLNSSKMKENSKAIFLSLSFLWASLWSSPTKSFHNVKWLTNEMFFCQRHIAYQIKLLNNFTLSFHLNCVAVFGAHCASRFDIFSNQIKKPIEPCAYNNCIEIIVHVSKQIPKWSKCINHNRNLMVFVASSKVRKLLFSLKLSLNIIMQN